MNQNSLKVNSHRGNHHHHASMIKIDGRMEWNRQRSRPTCPSFASDSLCLDINTIRADGPSLLFVFNSLHTTLILFLYFHYRLRPSHSSLSFISSFPFPSSHLYISHSSHFTNYQSIVDQYTQSNKKLPFHSHTLTHKQEYNHGSTDL